MEGTFREEAEPYHDDLNLLFTPLSVDCHRWVFKMTGRRQTAHKDMSKKRGHRVTIQRDMNTSATSGKTKTCCLGRRGKPVVWVASNKTGTESW